MNKITKLFNLVKALKPQMLFLLKYVIRFVLSIFRRNIVYPRVVNFPVTNKCNYRCVMCNVWKPEYSSRKDMTAAEIGQVFSKKIFRKVRHVGISGGEPFIRKDILEVVTSICDALPKLRSISIITNASLGCTVGRVQEIKKELISRGISLDLEVSIDGIGEIHDRNRGVEGAFEKTLDNFRKLQKFSLVNRISTTITRVNCDSLWEMYRFARENNVRIDFRLASLIDRLYNRELYDNFNFSDIEKLKIIKFLENIIFYYERSNPDKQLFYTSLIGMLKGEKRRSGCDWQTSFGVSLDPYGNLFYCFPKSELIANINNDSGADLDILYSNISKLKETRTHCDRCTHGYHGLADIALVLNLYGKFIRGKIRYLHNTKVLAKPSPPASRAPMAIKNISIIGWYGTETLGDKAIIGGIIDNLLKDDIGQCDITIVSLKPSYTLLTVNEMGLAGVKVMDVRDVRSDDKFIMSQDLFIFGGGPLLDIEEMVDMLEIFIKAKEYGKKTFIYGAGVGPIKRARYIKALKKMLLSSDKYCFRDKLSVIKLKELFPDLLNIKDAKAFIDPAVTYIRNRISQINGHAIINSRYVLFSFRDWPFICAGSLSKEAFDIVKNRFEDKLLQLIKSILESGVKIVLMPMNTYYMGDDDREYYLKCIKTLGHPDDIILLSHDITPLESLNYFKNAQYAVCMRFHSVVFSVAVNTPCIAIDYLYDGGKVSGFTSQLGLNYWLYSIAEFNEAAMSELMKRADTVPDWTKVNEAMSEKSNEMHEYMTIYQDK